MKSAMNTWMCLIVAAMALCFFSCAQESVKESSEISKPSEPTPPPSQPALQPGEVKEESLSGSAQPSVNASASGVSPIMIRQVQHRLNALNFKVGTPDGKLGGQTVKALKAYQKSRGMVPDGKLTEEVYLRLSSDKP